MYCSCANTIVASFLGDRTNPNLITMNTGDMEKYCLKPHPVYFNEFSVWQQVINRPCSVHNKIQYVDLTQVLESTYMHMYVLQCSHVPVLWQYLR